MFDALGPEGRVLARKAGLELLALRDRPDLLFSVFVVGNRLRLLQQFTSDRAGASGGRRSGVREPRSAGAGA